MGPGTSRTLANVLCPSTSASFGLMGMTLKPCFSNARSALLPNFLRLLEAPITATVLVCVISTPHAKATAGQERRRGDLPVESPAPASGNDRAAVRAGAF